MSAQKFSLQSRQAIFTALVAAKAAGESELGSRRILSAILRTAAAEAVCSRANVSASELLKSFEDSEAPTFAQCLLRVEAELTRVGHSFGSAAHFASVQAFPVSSEARNTLAGIDALFEESSNEPVTPLHVLLVLSSEGAIASKLAAHGLTNEVLRAAVNERPG